MHRWKRNRLALSLLALCAVGAPKRRTAPGFRLGTALSHRPCSLVGPDAHPALLLQEDRPCPVSEPENPRFKARNLLGRAQLSTYLPVPGPEGAAPPIRNIMLLDAP